MTDEEIEEMCEQERCEQMERINSAYNVRDYHYEHSGYIGYISEEYQEVYYQLQDLEQELTNLLNQTTDKSIIFKVNDKKMKYQVI